MLSCAQDSIDLLSNQLEPALEALKQAKVTDVGVHKANTSVKEIRKELKMVYQNSGIPDPNSRQRKKRKRAPGKNGGATLLDRRWLQLTMAAAMAGLATLPQRRSSATSQASTNPQRPLRAVSKNRCGGAMVRIGETARIVVRQ